VPDNDPEKEPRRGRRTAVALAGGLAAGVILTGVPVAEPAGSIRDQFQSAFVAGSARVDEALTVQIVLGE